MASSHKAPHITLHALDRASQRWGISPASAAEAAIREVLAKGEIKTGEKGIKFLLPVGGGLVRVAHVSSGGVMTVSTKNQGNRNTRRVRAQRQRAKERYPE